MFMGTVRNSDAVRERTLSKRVIAFKFKGTVSVLGESPRNLGNAMETIKSVEELCLQHGLDYKALAARAGLDEQRTLAIVLGRWTPSPTERDKVAAVFGVGRDHISWGHKVPIQHIYGHGPA
jgi:hypothetical protein